MANRTPAQERMLTRLRAFEAKFSKAQQHLTAMEEERTALYIEARETDPPVTFRDIAAVFGCTEAAVMQKINRTKKDPSQ